MSNKTSGQYSAFELIAMRVNEVIQIKTAQGVPINKELIIGIVIGKIFKGPFISFEDDVAFICREYDRQMKEKGV